jgi:cytosine/adenosine deaminase-related metal-dependent hydrolase
VLSGTTTVLDYFYPFVKGKKGTMEATIKAANDIGVRFTSVRGSMSQSKKQGTLYDESVVEDLDNILSHSKEVIEKFHNSEKFSMTRIGVGPCLPFSSVEKDFSESAMLARKFKDVILQTHAAESAWEVEYCKKKFKVTPIGLMEKTKFLGSDVSLVHCNIISEKEIKLLGKTKTNVIITPVCNTRDASDGNGIAPMSKLLKAGANLSIGVDGPASNDSMNLQTEMRFLRTVGKAKEGLFWYRNHNQAKFTYMNPLGVLKITNLGGAKTLNRKDIGSIKEGKAADIAIFDPDSEISHAGAVNKWATIMSCQSIKPKYLIINGQVVVKDGHLTKLDENIINTKFRKFHKNVLEHAQKRLKQNLIDY